MASAKSIKDSFFVPDNSSFIIRNRSRITSRGSRCFTLIELLVVVAIIGILTAILLPSLQNAKAKGQQAACASNLRQIYLAFAMYAGDWDNYFPWTGLTGPPYWYTRLGPYLGSRDGSGRRPVLRCPAERTERAGTPTWPTGVTMTMYENMGSSYMMSWSINQYSGRTPSDGPPLKGFGGPIDNPMGLSEASFITDMQVVAQGGDYPEFAWGLNDPSAIQTYWNPWFVHMYRHSDFRINMLYLDGHEIGRASCRERV